MKWLRTRCLCQKSRKQISWATFVILTRISRDNSLRVCIFFSFFESYKTVNNLSRTFGSTSHMKNLFCFERWTYFILTWFPSVRYSRLAKVKYFREFIFIHFCRKREFHSSRYLHCEKCLKSAFWLLFVWFSSGLNYLANGKNRTVDILRRKKIFDSWNDSPLEAMHFL